MRAVRFEGPGGESRLGALDGDVVHDAGPLGRDGFIPSAEGWARVAAAAGERECRSPGCACSTR